MHVKLSLWRQINAHTHASCMQLDISTYLLLENTYTCFTKPSLHIYTHSLAQPQGRFKHLCGWLCHNCSVIQVLFALPCKLGHLIENEQFDKSMMIRLQLIGTNYPRLSYLFFYFFQATRAKCTCQSKQYNTIKAFSVEACRSSRPCAMRAFSFKQTLTIRPWHHQTPVVWEEGKWETVAFGNYFWVHMQTKCTY